MEIQDIPNWSSSKLYTVQIRHGLSEDDCTLKVRWFIPRNGDRLHQTWWDGMEHRKHLTPPFAIANMKEAATEIKRYLEVALETSVRSLLGTGDELVTETYQVALWHMKTAPVC
jgi:hypothetical protein